MVVRATPMLVIVGGAPGSGKSTLARRLAAELGLPLVARDDLKEVLYDTLGAPDRAASLRLGGASFWLMHRVATRLLEAPAGVRGLVLESNFRRGLAEPDLAPLVARARAVLVHCHGDPSVIVRRYRERAARGERHPGHHDLELVDAVAAALAGGVYQPPELGIPTLSVDTTAGSDGDSVPAFAQVVASIRAAVAAAPDRSAAL